MDRARLSVIDAVYYQSPQGEPVVTESRFARWLSTTEQPYSRRLLIGEDWTALDTGWLEQTGMLVLENEGLPPGPEQPSAEERAAAPARILEVACCGMNRGCWIIPPGESMRAQPDGNPAQIRVRCRQGQTHCKVTLYPE